MSSLEPTSLGSVRSTSIEKAAISLVAVPGRTLRHLCSLISFARIASFNFLIFSLARTVHCGREIKDDLIQNTCTNSLIMTQPPRKLLRRAPWNDSNKREMSWCRHQLRQRGSVWYSCECLIGLEDFFCYLNIHPQKREL